MLCRRGYCIEKSECSDAQKIQITKELYVKPENLGDYGALPVQGFRVYTENSKQFFVPRFYGDTLFGRHKKSNLKCKEINIGFTGSLRSKTFQDVACKKIIEDLHEKGGSILSLPVGYGKTCCSLYIVSQMKVKTLILVHKEFLMNQWIERIQEFLPDARIGKLQRQTADVEDKDIVIGMIQSISCINYDKDHFEGFGMVIADEMHHICTRTFSKAIPKCSSKYMLGLSATPNRKDGLTKVLHWFFGEIGFSVQAEAPHVNVECLKFGSDFPDIPLNKLSKPNIPEMINMLCEMEERNKLIYNCIQKYYKEGRKILLLSDRREHCKQILKWCILHNIESGLYIGQMKEHELKLSEKKQVIIGTYSLAHEGLDIPSLNTLILATPKSEVTQACGRILRSKTQFEPLIIDIIDKWGVFYAQSNKRKAIYRKNKYNFEENKKRPEKTKSIFMFLEDHQT